MNLFMLLTQIRESKRPPHTTTKAVAMKREKVFTHLQNVRENFSLYKPQLRKKCATLTNF
jgi:hypothetical protein